MAEPIDWDIVAQRLATEAGITDGERILGINAGNYEEEIALQTGKVASEVAQGIFDKGYTYSEKDSIYSTQQIAEQEGTGPEQPVCGTDADGNQMVYNAEIGACVSPYSAGEAPLSEDYSIINSMQDTFRLALRNMGFSPDDVDGLWEWAKTRFQSDSSFTAERALLEMYDQKPFKDRFPAIAQMRDAGEKVIPSPSEYIDFEKDVANELHRFGVTAPQGFTNLITSLITNKVGMIEVSERLSEAENVMWNMPQEVTDTFNDWFGEDGTRDITMTLFLDPKQNWSNLKDQIATAEVGGWGQMIAGLDEGWNATQAQAISNLGLTQAQTWNTFADLKQKEMLFIEKAGERDLDMATHGVSAEFGIDVPGTGEEGALELADILDRRAEERIAEMRGGGGAMVTTGVTGFGKANA